MSTGIFTPGAEKWGVISAANQPPIFSNTRQKPEGSARCLHTALTGAAYDIDGGQQLVSGA